MMDIAIAVDASGSVSPADFTVFVSEVNSILKMMKPEKISLIQFDTRIISVDEVHDIHELSKVDFSGQGGTEITCVLDWAKEHKPQLLLVFTDGFFQFYDDKNTSNIVWLIHNNDKFNAPFGKTIHYKI